MNTKHTPGPWKDGPVFHKDGRAIFFTNDSKPGKWQQRLDDRSGLFSVDDARLIAAAPDVTRELERLIARIEQYHTMGFIGGAEATEATRDARAALSKARGE